MEGQPHRTQALPQIYQRKLHLHGCGGPGFTKTLVTLWTLFSVLAPHPYSPARLSSAPHPYSPAHLSSLPHITYLHGLTYTYGFNLFLLCTPKF